MSHPPQPESITTKLPGRLFTPDGVEQPCAAAVSYENNTPMFTHLEVPIRTLLSSPYETEEGEFDLYMLDEAATESLNEGLTHLREGDWGYEIGGDLLEGPSITKPIYMIGELNSTQLPFEEALAQGVVFTHDATVASWVASQLNKVVAHKALANVDMWNELVDAGLIDAEPEDVLLKATIAHTNEHGAFPAEATLVEMGKSLERELASAFSGTTPEKWAQAIRSASEVDGVPDLFEHVPNGEALRQRVRLEVANQALAQSGTEVPLYEVDGALPLVPASGHVKVESLSLPVNGGRVSATVYHVSPVHPDYGFAGELPEGSYAPSAVVLNHGNGRAQVYVGEDVIPAITPLIDEVRRNPNRDVDAPELGLSTPKLAPR